jgi:hypothetical protein
VLDDLAVLIQAKNIDPGPITFPWPLLVAVQDDEIPLSDSSFEFDPLAGYSLAIRLKYSVKAALPSATAGLCWM